MNKKQIIATNDFAKSLLENQSWKDSVLNKQPARPERNLNIFDKVRQSLDVLLGKADALYWHEDN